MRRVREQVADEANALKQMLEVVQHQQQVFSTQIGEQLLLWFAIGINLEADGVSYCRNDVLWRTKRLQSDEMNPVGKRSHLGRRFQRQPRLADATGADQRQQTAVGSGQQGRYLSKFPRPADEGCC